jgi:hypothetical protein
MGAFQPTIMPLEKELVAIQPTIMPLEKELVASVRDSVHVWLWTIRCSLPLASVVTAECGYYSAEVGDFGHPNVMLANPGVWRIMRHVAERFKPANPWVVARQISRPNPFLLAGVRVRPMRARASEAGGLDVGVCIIFCMTVQFYLHDSLST